MQLIIIEKQYLQDLPHKVNRIDKTFGRNGIQATTENGKQKRRVDSKNVHNTTQKSKRFLKRN